MHERLIASDETSTLLVELLEVGANFTRCWKSILDRLIPLCIIQDSSFNMNFELSK